MALQPVETLTVRDRVFAAIKEAILAGTLAPGEHLVEAGLAAEL